MVFRSIRGQAESLGLPYPEGQDVGTMRAAGFVVDDFIPARARYEAQRPDHPAIVNRSMVADEGYVFAWTVTRNGYEPGFLELMAARMREDMWLATDRAILADLMGLGLDNRHPVGKVQE